MPSEQCFGVEGVTYQQLSAGDTFCNVATGDIWQVYQILTRNSQKTELTWRFQSPSLINMPVKSTQRNETTLTNSIQIGRLPNVINGDILYSDLKPGDGGISIKGETWQLKRIVNSNSNGYVDCVWQSINGITRPITVRADASVVGIAKWLRVRGVTPSDAVLLPVPKRVAKPKGPPGCSDSCKRAPIGDNAYSATCRCCGGSNREIYGISSVSMYHCGRCEP